MLGQIGVKATHPFHVAAGLGDLDAIKEFLSEGKSINARDGFGATPLLIATVAGKDEVVDFLLDSSEGRNGVSITFFGGETLLNFKTIQAATEHARSWWASTTAAP